MLKSSLGITSTTLTAEQITSRLGIEPTWTDVWPPPDRKPGDERVIHQWSLTFDTAANVGDDDPDAPSGDELLSAQLVALGPDVAARVRALVSEGAFCGLIMFDEIDLQEMADDPWRSRRDYQLSPGAVAWLAAAGALTRVSLVFPQHTRPSTGEKVNDSEHERRPAP